MASSPAEPRPILGLSQQFLASIRPIPVERILPPGVAIEEQGYTPDTLQVILEGVVQMYATSSGRVSTVELMSAPDAVGLAAIVTQEPLLASFVTLSRCRLLAVNAKAAREKLRDDGEFASAVARQLALQTRRRVRALHNQKLRTGIERLASWVLVQWLEAGRPDGFRRPVQKQVLASLLGLTPESLSRCCTQLEHHGASLVGSDIRVFDPGQLAALAQPSELLDGVSVCLHPGEPA